MALKLSCVSKNLQKCLPKCTKNDKSNSYSAYSNSEIRSIEHDKRQTKDSVQGGSKPMFLTLRSESFKFNRPFLSCFEPHNEKLYTIHI